MLTGRNLQENPDPLLFLTGSRKYLRCYSMILGTMKKLDSAFGACSSTWEGIVASSATSSSRNGAFCGVLMTTLLVSACAILSMKSSTSLSWVLTSSLLSVRTSSMANFSSFWRSLSSIFICCPSVGKSQIVAYLFDTIPTHKGRGVQWQEGTQSHKSKQIKGKR